VLIVGDVMIDSYKIGNVNRISPEAPVPVVFVENLYERLGGAANVALNIKALGAEPILCSAIGNDTNADLFVKLLTAKELTTNAIIKDDDRITTVKTRVISRGQQLLRIDDEIDKPITKEAMQKLYQKIKDICETQKIDAIIFEDYDKGVITKELIISVIGNAKEKNILTAVDPKQRNFGHYCGVTMFKPNFPEFSNGLKKYFGELDLNNLETVSRKFLAEKNIENLLLTLSEEGIFIANNSVHYRFPAQKRDIADVSGAGDTVISIATLLLTFNTPLDEIAYISNIAGGLVCEKSGVVPISLQDLIMEFDN
jgi:rfaE bifunctional protein kinase chain/domain